ncbi:MAG: FecR domain-containing protein [Deltaproteobacteria bacterium]|nr:FecR domain-containing protein [Deltaproteobacteria bacterium]
MRKKVAAVAVGSFLSGMVCSGVSLAAGEAVSTMVAVKGNTFIERDREERPAKVRDDVLLIDTVATREAAKAKMLFIDDSVLTLGEKTRVVVKEYVYSKEKGGKSIFNLLDGKMKAVVGKAKFEVHTPTAVAAARGTVFLIETGIRNGVPFTDVFSIEGEVVVTPQIASGARGGGPGAGDSGSPTRVSADGAMEVVLTPGDFVSVTPGEPLPLPAAAPPSVLGGFLAATESVSFEMPVPSPGQIEILSPTLARGVGPSGVGSSMDPTGPADPGLGSLPPIAQQPIASTTTQVRVGATFP